MLWIFKENRRYQNHLCFSYFNIQNVTPCIIFYCGEVSKQGKQRTNSKGDLELGDNTENEVRVAERLALSDFRIQTVHLYLKLMVYLLLFYYFKYQDLSSEQNYMHDVQNLSD